MKYLSVYLFVFPLCVGDNNNVAVRIGRGGVELGIVDYHTRIVRGCLLFGIEAIGYEKSFVLADP